MSREKAAVVDNPDSDFSGAETEFESDTERSHEREPDSGNELDGERAESSTSQPPLLEANSSGRSDTYIPCQREERLNESNIVL